MARSDLHKNSAPSLLKQNNNCFDSYEDPDVSQEGGVGRSNSIRLSEMVKPHKRFFKDQNYNHIKTEEDSSDHDEQENLTLCNDEVEQEPKIPKDVKKS